MFHGSNCQLKEIGQVEYKVTRNDANNFCILTVLQTQEAWFCTFYCEDTYKQWTEKLSPLLWLSNQPQEYWVYNKNIVSKLLQKYADDLLALRIFVNGWMD